MQGNVLSCNKFSLLSRLTFAFAIIVHENTAFHKTNENSSYMIQVVTDICHIHTTV